jgi:hypothetical protein
MTFSPSQEIRAALWLRFFESKARFSLIYKKLAMRHDRPLGWRPRTAALIIYDQFAGAPP